MDMCIDLLFTLHKIDVCMSVYKHIIFIHYVYIMLCVANWLLTAFI